MQRLREGHGEGGAAWLRTELEAKSTSDLRQLCAKLELPQQRDGRTLRKEQLLESIVDCFSMIDPGLDPFIGPIRHLALDHLQIPSRAVLQVLCQSS